MGADRRRGGQTLGVGQAEFLIAALLVAVAGLSALARRLGIPYPIVLVIGGALLGFVPGLPEVNLDPDVVLVVFLPPLLYSAAFFANLGDLRQTCAPISLTRIGLVLVTMCAVALRRARSSSPACPGRRRSCSARSSPPPTRSPAR